MLWQAIGAARDLARAHEIATVLIRYGFSDLVRRIGLGNALEKAGRALHWHGVDEWLSLGTPERVRRALEDLGPTSSSSARCWRRASICSRPNGSPSSASSRTLRPPRPSRRSVRS